MEWAKNNIAYYNIPEKTVNAAKFVASKSIRAYNISKDKAI